MSATIVHNALLDILQKDSALNSEFSALLTGTVSSSSTIVTGSGTLFSSELAVDDYIGTASKGYRKVITITSDTVVIVESAFDTALATEAIYKTETEKGFMDLANTAPGKLLRVHYTGSSDIDGMVAKQMGLSTSQQNLYAAYRFVLIVLFYEPNPITADERKCTYEKMIRDVIDNNMTIDSTCVGNTEIGTSIFTKHVEDAIYYGVIPLLCFKKEIRGNR